MAWMLQPHNWTQAVRPNLYNVGYRRNLAYKGMGAFALPPPGPQPLMTYYPGARPTATAYWRLRGLGQGIVQGMDNPTDTPMVDVYQLSSGGQLLSTSQYVGSAPASVVTAQTQNVAPTTGVNWILLAAGGLLLLLILKGGR